MKTASPKNVIFGWLRRHTPPQRQISGRREVIPALDFDYEMASALPKKLASGSLLKTIDIMSYLSENQAALARHFMREKPGFSCARIAGGVLRSGLSLSIRAFSL